MGSEEEGAEGVGEREKKIHIFRGGEIEVALCALTELRLRTEKGPRKILKVLSMYHHPLLVSSILSVLKPKAKFKLTVRNGERRET